MMTSRRQWLIALLILLMLQLSACGFRLRGAIALPESLSTISIEGTTEHTDIGRVLYRSLKRGGVIITSADEAALRLQILRDEVVRRVLSVDATGKANEYELKHLLKYSATDSKGKVLIDAQEISTTRAYTFDPNSILAKGDEEQQLRKSMILSSAQQLLRQLSAAMRRHAAQQTAPANKADTATEQTKPTVNTPAEK